MTDTKQPAGGLSRERIARIKADGPASLTFASWHDLCDMALRSAERPDGWVAVPSDLLEAAIKAIADTEIINVAAPYKSDFRTKDLRPLKLQLEALLAAREVTTMTPATKPDAQTPSDEVSRAYEVPLVERLRAIPQDYRAEIETQWAEDGRATGHRFIPVGHLMHLAANELTAARQRCEELVKERSEILNVKSVEGLTSSEWLLRTAKAEARADRANVAIKDFAVIAKLHDKSDATITIRQGLKVWTSRHAEAIDAAMNTGEANG